MSYLDSVPTPHYCRPPEVVHKGERWLCECGRLWIGTDLYDALPTTGEYRHAYDAAVWKAETSRHRRLRVGEATLGDRFVTWFLSDPALVVDNPDAPSGPGNI